MKYYITDIVISGEVIRRLNIIEPMTLQEINTVMRQNEFTKKDEVLYRVGMEDWPLCFTEDDMMPTKYQEVVFR